MGYLEDLEVFLGEIYQSGFKEGARERTKEPPYKCSQCGARIWYRPDNGLCPECHLAPNEGLSLKEKVEELTKELDNSRKSQDYLKGLLNKEHVESERIREAARQDERRDWNAWLCLTHELEAPLDAEAGAHEIRERIKHPEKFKPSKEDEYSYYVPCHKCNGRGFIEKEDFSRLTCGVCGGSGKIY
jgi:hypothetical protein